MATPSVFRTDGVGGDRTMRTLLEFRAGKMHMNNRTVTADPRKGLLQVCYSSDDQLTHLLWKDRSSGLVEDHFFIIPDECELRKVRSTPARVFVLKWHVSSDRFFLWMQDPNAERDDQLVARVNQILKNGANGSTTPPAQTPQSLAPVPDAVSGERGASATAGSSPRLSSVPPPSPAPAGPAGGGGGARGRLTAEQLRRYMRSYNAARAQMEAAAGAPDLGEILAPDLMEEALAAEGMSDALVPLLELLPEQDRSVAAIPQLLRSPPFRAQAAALSAALRSGHAGELVRSFGIEPQGDDGPIFEMGAFLQALFKYGRGDAADDDDNATDDS